MNTHVRGVFISKRWHVQRLTATVSPSPTVSMLRSMRSSKCSFLLRESRIKEVTSPGAGRTTFPPHSTFKGNEEYFTPSEHLCASVCAASTDVVDGDDAALPNQLQRPLVVVVIVGFIGINEHKVVGSGLACCYQLILGTKKTNSIPKSASKNKSTYLAFATPTDAWSRFYVQFQPVEKDWADFCNRLCFTQVLCSSLWYLQDLLQFLYWRLSLWFRETFRRLRLWRKSSHLFEKRFGDVDVRRLYLAGHHLSVGGHRQGHAQGVVASVHSCRGDNCPAITAAGHHSHHKLTNNGGLLKMLTLFLVLLYWIIMEKWFNCVAYLMKKNTTYRSQ